MNQSADLNNSIERACQYLITKASDKSTGKCAAFVRSAFDFGFGKEMPRTNAAKDYGPLYEKIGFKKVFSFPAEKKEDYIAKIGDLAIIQYEPYGHICLNTPKGWISDFKQRDMYGGKIRDKNPAFDIYRYEIA